MYPSIAGCVDMTRSETNPSAHHRPSNHHQDSLLKLGSGTDLVPRMFSIHSDLDPFLPRSLSDPLQSAPQPIQFPQIALLEPFFPLQDPSIARRPQRQVFQRLDGAGVGVVAGGTGEDLVIDRGRGGRVVYRFGEGGRAESEQGGRRSMEDGGIGRQAGLI